MATVLAEPLLADTYQSARPFPHIVLDRFLDTARLRAVVGEIKSGEVSSGFDFYGSQAKRGISRWEGFGPDTRALIEELNHPFFVAWIGRLARIEGLAPDPDLLGAGVHQIGPGGFLKIHTDFTWHRKLKMHRRVNLLLYLNEDWQDEWGGHLELWPPDLGACGARIAPIFNRVVIFSTTDGSYHGHPDPLRCPEHVRRNSIALYYYAAEPAEASAFGKSELTNYRERPGERFASLKHRAHQLLIRSGLGRAVMRFRRRGWPSP